MEIKLKPCPFCGSEAVALDPRDLYEHVQAVAGPACLAAYCENPDCGAQVTAYNDTDGPLPYEPMAKMAAEKWNRRS